MSSTGRLPITLRQEAFGGIVFDPLDGTFIELDHEGFSVITAFAHSGGELPDPHTQTFIQTLRNEINGLEERAFRLIAPAQTISAGIPVLSAPTLVDFQITNQCFMDCPHCYAESTSAGEHGLIDDIAMALDQIAEVGALQVALGGGEPLLHPEIGWILERCHELGIVPNLTTSGLSIDDRKVALLQRYCGAVGVSLEGVGSRFDQFRKAGFRRFEKLLDRLREAAIPTVVQVTLNMDTLATIDEIVDYSLRQSGLYGVIFLAFKPVGRGTRFGKPLATLPHAVVHAHLMRAFEKLARHCRVGFDCCLTPAVIGTGSDFDEHAAQYLEGCSALRTSIGLSHKLDVMPCTFTAGHSVGNLHQRHLAEIWRDLSTQAFRREMAARRGKNNKCTECGNYGHCLGGCPVMPLVDCGNAYLSSPEVCLIK